MKCQAGTGPALLKESNSATRQAWRHRAHTSGPRRQEVGPATWIHVCVTCLILEHGAFPDSKGTNFFKSTGLTSGVNIQRTLTTLSSRYHRKPCRFRSSIKPSILISLQKKDTERRFWASALAEIDFSGRSFFPFYDSDVSPQEKYQGKLYVYSVQRRTGYSAQ